MRLGWLSGLPLVIACGPVVPVEDGDPDGDTSAVGSVTGDSADPTSTTNRETLDSGDDRPAEVTGPVLDLPPPIEVDGTYLLAVSFILAPDLPLQDLADIHVANGSMDIELTALTLDPSSTTSPRQPYGDPILYQGIPMNGSVFELDLGEHFVPGPTNPITGADVLALVTLRGTFTGSEPAACGDVDGMIISPLNADLAGSTFAATPASPEALPDQFDWSCIYPD